MASAYLSHYVFQPPNFILYLESGSKEILKNKSVRSIYYISEILIEISNNIYLDELKSFNILL